MTLTAINITLFNLHTYSFPFMNQQYSRWPQKDQVNCPKNRRNRIIVIASVIFAFYYSNRPTNSAQFLAQLSKRVGQNKISAECTDSNDPQGLDLDSESHSPTQPTHQLTQTVSSECVSYNKPFNPTNYYVTYVMC